MCPTASHSPPAHEVALVLVNVLRSFFFLFLMTCKVGKGRSAITAEKSGAIRNRPGCERGRADEHAWTNEKSQRLHISPTCFSRAVSTHFLRHVTRGDEIPAGAFILIHSMPNMGCFDLPRSDKLCAS